MICLLRQLITAIVPRLCPPIAGRRPSRRLILFTHAEFGRRRLRGDDAPNAVLWLAVQSLAVMVSSVSFLWSVLEICVAGLRASGVRSFAHAVREIVKVVPILVSWKVREVHIGHKTPHRSSRAQTSPKLLIW